MHVDYTSFPPTLALFARSFRPTWLAIFIMHDNRSAGGTLCLRDIFSLSTIYTSRERNRKMNYERRTTADIAKSRFIGRKSSIRIAHRVSFHLQFSLLFISFFFFFWRELRFICTDISRFFCFPRDFRRESCQMSSVNAYRGLIKFDPATCNSRSCVCSVTIGFQFSSDETTWLVFKLLQNGRIIVEEFSRATWHLTQFICEQTNRQKS